MRSNRTVCAVNLNGLEVPDDFPKSIKLDTSGIPDKIQVVDIPELINLISNIPSEIKLVMPEKAEGSNPS